MVRGSAIFHATEAVVQLRPLMSSVSTKAGESSAASPKMVTLAKTATYPCFAADYIHCQHFFNLSFVSLWRVIKMRNQLWAFLFFYQRLAFSALLFASLLYLISGKFSFTAIGIFYFFIVILFQYVMYEHINKQEYIFYYHLGLSRKKLWILSVTFSAVITLIFLIV